MVWGYKNVKLYLVHLELAMLQMSSVSMTTFKGKGAKTEVRSTDFSSCDAVMFKINVSLN